MTDSLESIQDETIATLRAIRKAVATALDRDDNPMCTSMELAQLSAAAGKCSTEIRAWAKLANKVRLTPESVLEWFKSLSEADRAEHMAACATIQDETSGSVFG